MNKLWFVPLISILVLVIAGFLAQTSYDSGVSEVEKSISISDVSSDIALEYGYYTGKLKGTLVSSIDTNHLHVVVEFYDESGAKINNADSYSFNQDDVVAGQRYKIDAFYMSEIKPSKAIINVYNEYGSNDPVTIQEVQL